jgi:hypothetical protein
LYILLHGLPVGGELEYADINTIARALSARKFTLAFLGYGNEAENTAIELTYNWGKSDYQIGSSKVLLLVCSPRAW